MIIDLLHHTSGIAFLEKALAGFGDGKERFAPGAIEKAWDEVAEHVTRIKHLFPNATLGELGFGGAKRPGVLAFCLLREEMWAKRLERCPQGFTRSLAVDVDGDHRVLALHAAHGFQSDLITAVGLSQIIGVLVPVNLQAATVDAFQRHLGVEFQQDHHIRQPYTVQTQRARGPMQPTAGPEIRQTCGNCLGHRLAVQHVVQYGSQILRARLVGLFHFTGGIKVVCGPAHGGEERVAVAHYAV